MFNELKEVKYLKEIDFKSLNVKYFKETQLLKSLQKAEAYLEPKQTYTMEFFVEILNGILFS